MASFGKVLDLLDKRYLNLQDVTGNVEPLPALIPYEEYTQNVLVYRMDTNHEVFMALIQDFTERTARETGKELWTWCVQWDVEDTATNQLNTSTHSLKKPRVHPLQGNSLSNAGQQQRRSAAFDIVERRTIDSELMQEEDMLRILIDIIQVDSSIVPNFIEFLYRWIDFYEGDGKALKAALRHEIPSLWDFEYHPLILPADLKKHQLKHGSTKKTTTEGEKEGENEDEVGDQLPNDLKFKELSQSSPTKKMREKPDVAAIERQTEESERLQYREVRYGIQPPKLNEPLPPLINIPLDEGKRAKYYAACFRSRQRALNLLIEAGVSVPQISNYKKLQQAHPKDTPLNGKGNGLRHYYKDAQFAQARYVEKEKEMVLREKNMEIAISNRLAVEAQIAARTAKLEGSSGIPLIPPTAAYERRPDVNAGIVFRKKYINTINVVPTPLVGKMKSHMFQRARDKDSFNMLGRPDLTLRSQPAKVSHSSSEGSEDKSDSNDESENGQKSNFDRGSMNIPSQCSHPTLLPSLHLPRPDPLPTQPPTPPRRPPTPFRPETSSNPSVQLPNAYQNGISASGVHQNNTPNRSLIAEYLEDLRLRRAQQSLPMFGGRTDQTMTNGTGPQPYRPAFQSPMLNDLAARPSQGPATGIQRPDSSHQAIFNSSTNLSRPPIPSAATHQTQRASLPVSSSLPLLPSATFSAAPRATVVSRQAPHDSPPLHLPRPDRFPFDEDTRINPVPRPPTPYRPPLHPPRPDPVPFYNNESNMRTNPVSRPSIHHLSPPTRPPTTTVFPPQPGGRQSSNPIARNFEAQPQPSDVRPPSAPFQMSGLFMRAPNQQGPEPTFSNIGDLLNYQWSLRHPSASHQQTRQTPHNLPTTVHDPAPAPALPPPFAQRLVAIQRDQEATQGQEHATFSSRRSDIQRNPPVHPTLQPSPPSPLSSLAPTLLATAPFAASAHGMPIQIYMPKIVVPGNTIGPDGLKLGNGGIVETDAFLVGYCHPGSGKIVISKAIFLPVGVWANTLRRVRRGAYTVLETYAVPASHPKLLKARNLSLFNRVHTRFNETENPHYAVYQKLALAHSFMVSSRSREQDLTKRWRVTKGQMTQYARGAVWEGWAVTLDKEVEMGVQERKGAVLSSALIDEGVEKKRGGNTDEEERRRKEIDELMDEDSDEDMYM